MSVGSRVPLRAIEPRLDALLAELRPHCARIEFGGSVRRCLETIGDIELVVIPLFVAATAAPAPQAGLFSGAEPPGFIRRNALAEKFRRMQEENRILILKPGTREPIEWVIRDEGRYWRLALRSEEGSGLPAAIPLDVFLQDDATGGLNLMIRTGSGVGQDGKPEHGFAPAMLRRWKAMTGGHASGAQLYDGTGRLCPTPEEEDVFTALRMRWVEPWLRKDYRAVPGVRA